MSVLLPMLSLTALTLLLRHSLREDGWRYAFLLSAALLASLLVAICELLSAFYALTFQGVATAWAVSLAVIIAGCVLTGLRARPTGRQPGGQLGLNRADQVLLVGISLIVLLTGVVALSSATNNWDSMTYHMSRVMHWIQGRSLEHYPTAIDRQLYQPPFSGLAILTLQLLWGGDHLANLVQWFSMVGSLVAVGAIAGLLGAARRGQLIGMLVCCTLPMGILQSTSTQNDYAGAFWLVTLAYFVLRLRIRQRALDILPVGLCLGLAILTKGTAYIYAAPLMLWFGWILVTALPVRHALTLGMLVLVLACSFNATTWVRNQATFGTPLGVSLPPTAPHSFSNAVLTPAVLTSNVVRNVAIQLGVERPKSWNVFVERHVLAMHGLLGLSASDPNTTWTDTKFQLGQGSRHEDLASNPLHFLLACTAIAWIFFTPIGRQPAHIGLALCVTAAFLMFCGYLKWQPWHGRLHLPLFVLASPLIAVMLNTMMSTPRKAGAGLAVCLVLAVAAVPALLFNQSRPLLGTQGVLITNRHAQYFTNRSELRPVYETAVSHIRRLNCDRLVIRLGRDDWEYPLWVLLNEQRAGRVHIDHLQPAVGLRQSATRLKYCALFSTIANTPATLTVGEQVFKLSWQQSGVQIYEPAQPYPP